MTIGLVSAIPEEFNHLFAALSDTDDAPGRFNVGTLDGHRVVLAQSGMGKVNAAIVTSLLVSRFDCRAIVFSGAAGGLDPTLEIGDVVIADLAVQHDAGVAQDDKLHVYQAGHLPAINPTGQLGFRTDEALLTRVKDRLHGVDLPDLPNISAVRNGRSPKIVYGTVLTGDQFVNCGKTRVRLQEQFNGLAVEMEGGAVAQVCDDLGIPWLVIRTLSDLAGNDSSIDFSAFVEDAGALSSTIVRRLLPVL